MQERLIIAELRLKELRNSQQNICLTGKIIAPEPIGEKKYAPEFKIILPEDVPDPSKQKGIFKLISWFNGFFRVLNSECQGKCVLCEFHRLQASGVARTAEKRLNDK